MPVRKVAIKTTKPRVSKINRKAEEVGESFAPEVEEISQDIENSSKFKFSPKSFITKKVLIILIIIGLLLLIYYKKNWFIAATVNNTPITNFELISKMNSQFREQTLNQLINEKIILNEARKNNVVVRTNDIDQKISELEQSVGGAATLNTLLTQQGQTRNSLRDQLTIQITIEKLYEKDATVSAAEVTQFVEQNKSQLKASDSAGQTEEATKILKQQKLGEVFNKKFQELKTAAVTKIF